MTDGNKNHKSAPLKKRGTAVIIAVVLIALSIFGVGGSKLQGKVRAVEKMFYAEDGIASCIEERAEAAANITSLVPQISQAKAGSELKDMNKALEKYEKAVKKQNPKTLLEANEALEEAEIALMKKLKEPAKAMGGDVEKMLMGQSANFDSAGGKITYGAREYNKEAQKANDLLNGFPANIIRLLRGIREVELCE